MQTQTNVFSLGLWIGGQALRPYLKSASALSLLLTHVRQKPAQSGNAAPTMQHVRTPPRISQPDPHG
jgi:hypothetical protein